MSRVVHCKREPFDVYVGRGFWEGVRSPWGNPFSHKEGTTARFKVDTREEAIESYERWLLTQPHLLGQLWRLRGKVLGCWCAPEPCHGEVLARQSARSYIPFAGEPSLYRHPASSPADRGWQSSPGAAGGA